MAELPANGSDAAMCLLLADGPLPTNAIADRLAIRDRAVRYRLARLRAAGVVVTGPDGLHRLATDPLPAIAAPPVPTIAEPVQAFADPLPTIVASTDSDGPSPSHSGHWSPGTLLVAAGLGLAVAGVVAVALGSRGTPPAEPSPTPPPPPTRSGNAAGLPGGLGWSPW
ncbi:MAG: winged helix-turn-helix domain-containing protein [Candidatus Limnocylindrales bacterium]|jgi:hypothetical protein